MPRARRTTFTAPFVVVVVAGCSGGGSRPAEPRQRWSVQRDGDRCIAHQRVECPPPSVATCNPPPPMYLRCPVEAAGDSFEIVSLVEGSCLLGDRKTPVACPSWEPPPPPEPAPAPAPAPPADAAAGALREWTVTRAGGTCEADSHPCERGGFARGGGVGHSCNPPPPPAIACPPAGYVTIVETAPGTCEARVAPCEHAVKCNPPAPEPIACPPF